MGGAWTAIGVLIKAEGVGAFRIGSDSENVQVLSVGSDSG